MSKKRIRTFGRLVAVNDWEELDEKVKESGRARHKRINVFMFVSEEDEVAFSYLKANWDRIDYYSGSIADFFVIAPREFECETKTEDNNIALKLPPIARMQKVQEEYFKEEERFRTPSFVLFYDGYETDAFQINLAKLDGEEIHAVFEELMICIDGCVKEWKEANIRYSAKDVFHLVRGRLKKQKLVGALKLLPYKIPDSLYKAFIAYAVGA